MEIGDIFIYIYIFGMLRPHFVLRRVGRVKCLPFLKHSNHWERAQKNDFQGSNFLGLVLLERKSLCSTRTRSTTSFCYFIRVETAAYN